MLIKSFVKSAPKFFSVAIAIVFIFTAIFSNSFFVFNSDVGAADCGIFDEGSCTPNGCAWSQGTSCSGFDESSCMANSCTPNYGDCAAFSDGGSDGTSCYGYQSCSYDIGSGSCSGTYFVDCSGFYGPASCVGTYDAEAPVLSTATINGTTLTLTYDENLDGGSIPITTDFAITVNGNTPGLSSVNVSGTTVVIELSEAVISSDSVILGYTVGNAPIQDAVGNDANSLSNQVVQNTTPDSVAPVFSSATVSGATLTMSYNESLDTGSTPATTDLSVVVNGGNATVSAVNVTGSDVVLTLSTPVTFGKTVTVGYTPGASPIQDTAGNDASTLTQQTVTNSVNAVCGVISSAGSISPIGSASVGTKVYVANSGSATVSIIDTITNAISDVTVGPNPRYISVVGTKLYVMNNGTGVGSTTVSVINTLTGTVTDTITLGGGKRPYSATLVGTNLYVNNHNTNSVSVINTLTNTVTDTITVGTNPIYSYLAGNNLYVINEGTGANSVSVIDVATNTVTTTITVGTRPYSATLVGTKLYVINLSSSNVYIIETDPNDANYNTAFRTIDVGSDTGTYLSTLVGTKLYVIETSSNKLYVINTNTDLVTTTIDVGTQPFASFLVGTKLYVSNYAANTISVIDTYTDTVSSTINNTGSLGQFGVRVGNKIYLNNQSSNNISVVDTSIDAMVNICAPQLTSITSSTANGTYTTGQAINITANFNESIISGSKMRVTLNTGDTVDLTNVSGTTLYGTYTVGSGDSVPDLSVTAISGDESYTSVTDASSTPNTTISFAVPTSPELSGDSSYNLGDLKNILVGGPYCSISVGTEPYQMATVSTIAYVANQGSDNVSVVDTSDNTVTATITVGDQPYGVAYNSTSKEIYVANLKGNSVSVIDADPANAGTTYNTVTNTITVGTEPYYVASLGTKIYVTNNLSNNVSVINTATHTVTTSVTVGVAPRGIKAHGTDLYVSNFGSTYGNESAASGTVSVIDSTNNTVTATINVGAGPRGVAVYGDEVYVANWTGNSVSVISTDTNTVTHTIPVGNGPRGITSVGSNIYVENYKDGTVSIIATGSHSVTSTVYVGNTPSGMTAVGTDLYISRFTDGLVSILDTTSGAMRSSCEQDNTGPVISSVATSTTATTSTITWTTSEAATSTIDFGLTSSYGTASSTSVSTTTHSIILSSLASSTVYHYKISSWDALGNLSTTTDATFTTLDVTVPTVSITVPINGASVAGSSVTLTATSSDDVAISGIQFSVDGASVGSSGTSSPYSITWDSTSVLDGTRTIRAVATDSSNNYATSTITVTVDNTAPVLTEGTVVPTPSTDTTPSYTFSSTEAGTITYGGSCTSGTTSAISGSNPITFTALAVGTYSDCTITVTDALSNVSNTLAVTSFTITSASSEDDAATTTQNTAGPSSGGGGPVYANSVVTTTTTALNIQPCTAGSVFNVLTGQVCPTTNSNNTNATRPTVSTSAGLPANYKFTKTTSLGVRNTEVLNLQKFLNSQGYKVSNSGAGSSGKETIYFGPATRSALARFQKANGIKPAVGYFGPITRAFINNLIKMVR